MGDGLSRSREHLSYYCLAAKTALRWYKVIDLLTRRVGRGLILFLISGAIPDVFAASTNTLWSTRYWQTDDGLPNNIVTAIAQTQDGCLWVGDPGGLARFDGIRFTEFNYLRAGVNDHPAVHTLLAGAAGGLWIVPSRGPVVYLNPQFTLGALPPDLPDSNPLFVAEDKEGCPWIGYASGAICQIKDGNARQFDASSGLAGGTIQTLISDGAGSIWVAKGNRLFTFNNNRFRQLAAFRAEPHIAAARPNGVWIAAGKQLFKCNVEGKLRDFGNFLPNSSRGEAREAIEDHTGAVWIGTDTEGLYRRNESGFEKVKSSYSYISSLAEDSEGNIWAGTLGGGLDRISHAAIQLDTVSEAPSSQPIQCVCEDTNGVLWGATQNGVLVSRVNGVWSPALTNLSLPKSVTCVAAGRDGGLWMGMRASKSLYCWRNNKLISWDNATGFIGTTVISLLPDSRSNVWMGINAYRDNPPLIQCLQEGNFRTFRLPINGEHVVTMAEDAAGNIWAGMSGGLLMRFDGEQFVDETTHTSASDRGIRCLYGTPDGALWIGYAGLGLGCLKDKHFTRITTEQGLRDDSVSQIVADEEGWFWLGSDHGIFKIRRDELDQVIGGTLSRVTPVFYGRNEGLFNIQANYGFWPNAIRTHDGHVVFPTRTALVTADPALLRGNAAAPKVVLTRMIVDDQTVADYGGIEDVQTIANLRTLNKALRLSPYHRNLKFEFTAFSFSAPENVHFRYRLDGLDNDWHHAETREASYSRLAAGDYAFRVEAASGDGPWKEARAPLAIVVAPFFWQTWWFRAGVIAIFILAVIAVVRYVSFRRLRRRLEALAQQAALDKERTRIARDLHDDLGGRLTEVKQLFELALRNHASPDSMQRYLERGLTKTQSGIQALDETVWAVNPHNDTLPYFIDYIGQSAVEFLHAADIPCRADLPPNPPERTISAEARHNLFLAVKEALNNIVRHAHASEVKLQATVTDNSITLTIKDNGRGFDCAPDNSTADGLRNMRQRMEEIGGEFSVETSSGAGTSVSLVYFWSAKKLGANGMGKEKETT